jgi:hypothetical protein
MDDLISAERVAEGLWQTINGLTDLPKEAHAEWLALPESEKRTWGEHAAVAIASWREWMGQP